LCLTDSFSKYVELVGIPNKHTDTEFQWNELQIKEKTFKQTTQKSLHTLLTHPQNLNLNQTKLQTLAA
jgi:hypothetical protein